MILINIRSFAGALSLSISVFLLSPASSQAEIIDRIVASAGNDAITLSDVEREGAAVFRDIKMNAPGSQRENLLYTSVCSSTAIEGVKVTFPLPNEFTVYPGQVPLVKQPDRSYGPRR